MKKRIFNIRPLVVTIACSFFAMAISAQSDSDSTQIDESDDKTSSSEQKTLEFIFRPTLGLGVGMFTFMGDVANNHQNAHPTVSRVGYDLRLSNPLNDYFDLTFYVLFGKLSANERSLTNLTRNLNFQSEVRTGGMVVNYNFQNFKKSGKSILEPYVFAGFESFEFLSKTDLFDQYGNKYHYWSDGSIRNLDESDPNSASSIILQRDYVYESDLREQNLDGFGKYRERSWALPIGLGAQLHLNERWHFRVGTSLHLTFSDLVDNVTDESVGDRVGNSKNDKFLFSHFSLNYDLQRLNEKESNEDKLDPDELFDILAKDTVDTDGDGVVDFIDFCQYTEKGIAVNEKGCPFDKDQDFVFDYKDDEVPTPSGSFVNEQGVAVTDEMIYQRYLRYIDTTGNLTGKIDTTIATSSNVGYTNANPTASNQGKNNLNYVVVLGTQEKSVSANELQKYLSFKDFKMIERGDSVIYIVGNYDNLDDAVKRKYNLEKDGIKTEGIASTRDDGKNGTHITNIPNNQLPNISGTNTENSSDEVIFRVQIGAFSKKLSSNVFKDVPDLIVIKGDDGITRYFSGAFTDIMDASQRKINMLQKGFDGAFVVAYQGGSRKPLNTVGVDIITPDDTDISHDTQKDAIDKSKIRYKVQVGAFKSDVPTQMLNKYLTIGGVVPKREDGLTKYFSGDFSTQAEANAAMQKIVAAGLPDAYVIADYNGKTLTIEELKTLLHE